MPIRIKLPALFAVVVVAAAQVAAQPPQQSPTSFFPSPGDTAADKEKGQMAAILLQPLAPRTYNWVAPARPILMQPAETHICLLTGISGNFAGGGERVYVDIDPGAGGGPRWVLGGSSGVGPVVRGTATCVAKNRFVNQLLSTRLGAYQLDLQRQGSCGPHNSNHHLNSTTSAFFITDMGGLFRGGGEAIGVGAQGPNASTVISACSGYVAGALTRVFATAQSISQATGQVSTVSANQPVMYATQTGRTSNIANATFTHNQPNASGSLRLVPRDEALCGLVSIGGKFQGLGESVDIASQRYPNGRDYWTLRVSNLAQNGYIAAAVRCFARDQRR